MLFCTETCSTFALDNEARTHNVSGERMQNKVALKKKKTMYNGQKPFSRLLYHIEKPVNNNRICCDWAPHRAEINTFLANHLTMGWYNSHAVVTHRLEIHHGPKLPKVCE